MMKPEDGAKLRAEWKAKGDLPCMHPFLSIETTTTGHLTGSYICRRCGANMKIDPSTPA
jgi:hypothetical protein